MVAPAFGFSVGDFIAAAQVLRSFAKTLIALDAIEEVKDFGFKLLAVQSIVQQLEESVQESSTSVNFRNAIKHMVERMMRTVETFQDRFMKHCGCLTADSNVSRRKEAKAKEYWNFILRNDAKELMQELDSWLLQLQIMQGLLHGCVLYSIKVSYNY